MKSDFKYDLINHYHNPYFSIDYSEKYLAEINKHHHFNFSSNLKIYFIKNYHLKNYFLRLLYYYLKYLFNYFLND